MSHDCDDFSVTFQCDTCDATFKVAGTDMALGYVGACAVIRAAGWRAFKRVGQPWTDACPECVASAEREHADHKRREDERERIKARNA